MRADPHLGSARITNVNSGEQLDKSEKVLIDCHERSAADVLLLQWTSDVSGCLLRDKDTCFLAKPGKTVSQPLVA